MAAIDKLYVKDFTEYEDLRLWALVYYPKLLLYFYDPTVTKYEADGRIIRFPTPIINTPFSIDKKLKWICPVPCVREYLHKQCGVNPKWEWFYRLFWRGKKYF